MKEIKKDIFEWIDEQPKGEIIILAHCISSDLAMGAGIAKPIQDKYKVRETIHYMEKSEHTTLTDWNKRGFAIVTCHPNIEDGGECNFHICNLVTKEKYWEKPTYTTLDQALTSAGNIIRSIQSMRGKPVKIVMPKIGCGLDRLRWENVKEMVAQWAGLDLDVTVCYL